MPWYPASVTKLMTTYVALSRCARPAHLAATPRSRSRPRAASVPPSKIGVKPGQEVTLDNALKIMLVKSANDMAVVIAEGVGGTVEDFADLMNREAAPARHAREPLRQPERPLRRRPAILGPRPRDPRPGAAHDFPDYADLFHIGAVQLGKRC